MIYNIYADYVKDKNVYESNTLERTKEIVKSLMIVRTGITIPTFLKISFIKKNENINVHTIIEYIVTSNKDETTVLNDLQLLNDFIEDNM